MPTNKHILIFILFYGSLRAFNLGEFAGFWEGVESSLVRQLVMRERNLFIIKT